MNEDHPACIALTRVLNELPGISVLRSACGFGKAPYRIFFWMMTDKVGTFLLSNAIRQTPGWEVRMLPKDNRWGCEFVLEGPAMESPRDVHPAAEELRKNIEAAIRVFGS